MLENEAKGWHGSYSMIGRTSAERYQLILMKDEILSGKSKKKHVKDFFESIKIFDEIPIDSLNSKKNEIDIFAKPPKQKEKPKLKKKLIKKRNISNELPTMKEIIPSIDYYIKKEKEKIQIPKQKINNNILKKIDKYSYSNLVKKQNSRKSTLYNPKLAFIWKKTITGPRWSALKGREEKNSKNKNSLNSTQNNFNDNDKIGVLMKKQTERGPLPTHYDLRIRTDRPFHNNELNDNSISKIKSKNNDNKKLFNNTECSNKFLKKNSNKNKKNKSLNHLKKCSSKKKIITQSQNKSLLNTENNNSNNKNNKTKKSNCLSEKIKRINTRSIDFSKSLSRDKINNFSLSKNIQNHSYSPKYTLVEPRCLTMVSYAKKYQTKSLPKRFIGVDPQLFFDPDKIIDNVNNHKKVHAPNFNIMAGRINDSGSLPSYMVKTCGRFSLETVTEKTLRMNNFCNVGFSKDYSTFYPKKTFNEIISRTLINNNKDLFTPLNDKKIENKRLVKLIEFYSKKSGEDFVNNNKFDAISLKTVDNKTPITTSRNKKGLYDIY